jgi:hypothetical protein
MKIVFALLLAMAPAFAAAPTEKEVTTVMETWRQAMLKGDAATLDKLLSKDLTYVHSSAKNETKAECIENATKPGSVAKSIELHNVTTRMYGATAIVKGTGDFTSGAGALSHLDFVMVWVKGAQGWQLVARQATKIP